MGDSLGDMLSIIGILAPMKLLNKFMCFYFLIIMLVHRMTFDW